MRRDTLGALPTLVLLSALIGISAPTSLPAQIMIPSRSGSRPHDDAIRMDVVLHHVPVGYPLAARKGHLTGRGILVGQVDVRTGHVTSVRMEKSTGYKILDDAALNAFRQWRFKPRTIRKFRTPISYTMAN